MEQKRNFSSLRGDYFLLHTVVQLAVWLLTSVCLLLVFFFTNFIPPVLRSLQDSYTQTDKPIHQHKQTWHIQAAIIQLISWHDHDFTFPMPMICPPVSEDKTFTDRQHDLCTSMTQQRADIMEGYRPAVVAPLILFLQVRGGAGAWGTGACGHVPGQDGGCRGKKTQLHC